MLIQNQIKVFKELYNVSRETIERLSVYEKLIIQEQKKYSLVGVSTLDNIWLRHFADSAKIFNIIKDLCLISKKNIYSFADIGSGAGFPGAVISIMAEAENIPINTVLVDSNKKKCSFLRIVKKELQLPYNVLNKRSEDIREKFDIIASRAVTSLGNFLKSNYNIIAKDSNLIVLKGKTWTQEVKESKKKWKFKLNVVKNNIQLDSSGGVTLIIRNLEK